MAHSILTVIAVLLYLLCGLVFSLVYAVIFRPDSTTAMVGLMAIFWPAFLVLDVLLQIAAGIGTGVRTISRRFLAVWMK